MSDQKETVSRPWFVYLLQCGDGSIYTGITTDIARRLAMHESGKGAKYTRMRGPLTLLGLEAYPDRSSASRAEYAIKQLSPAAKREKALAMMSAHPSR
ncbi:MAG: GIY-YIG nuclease family protein [Rhizobiales bacterium]|nr:GIY-YIG nuclease family protein [Hyphomicrobiales bacterium]